MGHWSGKTEVLEAFPDEWKQREASKFAYRIPSGESYADVRDLSSSFIDEIANGTSQRVSIASHQMILRTMIGHLAQMPADNTMQIRQPHGVVYEAQIENGHVRVCHWSGAVRRDGALLAIGKLNVS